MNSEIKQILKLLLNYLSLFAPAPKQLHLFLNVVFPHQPVSITNCSQEVSNVLKTIKKTFVNWVRIQWSSWHALGKVPWEAAGQWDLFCPSSSPSSRHASSCPGIQAASSFIFRTTPHLVQLPGLKSSLFTVFTLQLFLWFFLNDQLIIVYKVISGNTYQSNIWKYDLKIH